MYWYLLNLTSIRVPGLNITQNGFSQCNKKCGKCYTDSGNSWISLPLPESQCNDILSGKFDVLKKESMLLDIEGVNGTTITLSLPLLWLTEQFLFGHVVCTGTSGIFMLGFPIFQYYYLAYDMEAIQLLSSIFRYPMKLKPLSMEPILVGLQNLLAQDIIIMFQRSV